LNVKDLKKLLENLHKNLQILKEREAKCGGDAPLSLLNQIEDYQTAITLTENALEGNISVDDLIEGLKPLHLDIDGGGTQITIEGDKIEGDRIIMEDVTAKRDVIQAETVHIHYETAAPAETRPKLPSTRLGQKSLLLASLIGGGVLILVIVFVLSTWLTGQSTDGAETSTEALPASDLCRPLGQPVHVVIGPLKGCNQDVSQTLQTDLAVTKERIRLSSVDPLPVKDTTAWTELQPDLIIQGQCDPDGQLTMTYELATSPSPATVYEPSSLTLQVSASQRLNLPVRTGLALVNYAWGDFAAAAQSLADLQSRYSSPEAKAYLLMLEGNSWLFAAYDEVKHYEAAIQAYSKALELQPDWPEAYNNLGVVHLNQAYAAGEYVNFPVAETFFSKAITASDGKLLLALVNRANIYINQEATDLAVKDCQQALDLDDSAALSHLCLAQALIHSSGQSNVEEGTDAVIDEAITTALALDDHLAGAHYFQAEQLFRIIRNQIRPGESTLDERQAEFHQEQFKALMACQALLEVDRFLLEQLDNTAQ
jgi:tetratricopeptide (TPR) repeat protein